MAEGKAKAADVARQINQITGLETREVVLGHIQRGGIPTAKDRILGSRMGEAAVQLLLKGETDKCVGISNDKIITVPLSVATKPKQWNVEDYYKLVKILT